MIDVPHTRLAVDLVLLCETDGALHVVLGRRDDAAIVGGDFALPGAVMGANETPAETAARVAAQRVGGATPHLEQLATFGALDRDPRGRSVSTAYLGLSPAAPLQDAARRNDRLVLARLTDGASALPLAFDHAHIVQTAVMRLRGKIDYTPVGLSLLPERFTLLDAQTVWEAVLERSLLKPPFRRKLLARGIIEPTGDTTQGSAHRPAKLYRAAHPTRDQNA